jgi:hypothetical protein
MDVSEDIKGRSYLPKSVTGLVWLLHMVKKMYKSQYEESCILSHYCKTAYRTIQEWTSNPSMCLIHYTVYRLYDYSQGYIYLLYSHIRTLGATITVKYG